MGETVELERISVTLGGRPVLDEVTFTAPAGATTVVLGPSGCGKTTLLRVVCGLQAPDAGRVVVGGRDLVGVPAHRRGMGLAFQDRALFPHLDVAGNVGFGLRMAGVRPAEVTRRVAEVLGLVGLAGFEGRRVGRLSGGEAQRVALARALAPDPAALCLDEPLGSLDRVLHDRLVDDLRQLFASLEVTVLLVTHDHTEALALADHVVVLGHGDAGGRVLAAGSPADVWLRPPSVTVARFLGHQVLSSSDAAVLGVPVGDAAWVVVHPESVVLEPAGREAGEDARVTDTRFDGGRTVVSVEVTGVGTVRASVPTPTPVCVGDRVSVRVDPAGVWGLSS